MLHIYMRIQSNLVNSMTSELEVLFRIIRSSNYREVGIKIYDSAPSPKNILIISFFIY